MKPHLYLLLLTCIIALNCKAQKILVFDREHGPRIRFLIHDDIAVRTADNPAWEAGEITDIKDSAITIAEDVIPVSKIKAIRFESRSSWTNLLHQVTVLFPVFGVALLGIDAIDNVSNHVYPVYDERTLIIVGALIAAGPIAYQFTFHKYKINKHHRLKVIDVSIN